MMTDDQLHDLLDAAGEHLAHRRYAQASDAAMRAACALWGRALSISMDAATRNLAAAMAAHRRRQTHRNG
jgi:hypothetical protein